MLPIDLYENSNDTQKGWDSVSVMCSNRNKVLLFISVFLVYDRYQTILNARLFMEGVRLSGQALFVRDGDEIRITTPRAWVCSRLQRGFRGAAGCPVSSCTTVQFFCACVKTTRLSASWTSYLTSFTVFWNYFLYRHRRLICASWMSIFNEWWFFASLEWCTKSIDYKVRLREQRTAVFLGVSYVIIFSVRLLQPPTF